MKVESAEQHLELALKDAIKRMDHGIVGVSVSEFTESPGQLGFVNCMVTVPDKDVKEIADAIRAAVDEILLAKGYNNLTKPRNLQ